MADIVVGVIALLALLLSALGVTGFILALILLKLSRPKFAVALVLSLLMLVGGPCFCWRTLRQPIQRVSDSQLFGRRQVLKSNFPARSSGIILELRQGEQRVTLAEGETLSLKKGERITLTGVNVPGVAPSRIRVNVVGFIGNPNREAEDRNVEINTGNFLRKFALNPEGTRYKVAVLRDKEEIAAFFLDLK